MPRLRTHPGNMLRAELEARDLTANQLALAIRVPANRITAILRGEGAVSAETAVRLGRYLRTGAAFWMNLQTQYDISVVETTEVTSLIANWTVRCRDEPGAQGRPPLRINDAPCPRLAVFIALGVE